MLFILMSFSSTRVPLPNLALMVDSILNLALMVDSILNLALMVDSILNLALMVDSILNLALMVNSILTAKKEGPSRYGHLSFCQDGREEESGIALCVRFAEHALVQALTFSTSEFLM
ncbi:hypothetical protein P7K49_028553 [Saguinus oedipus]|uniref:Uncharacterized protein n=1 Tax=Saguinus oedipus TaxID=9490 RepID=A0ABQ9U5G4_SAGOE|nr:hypothetical protein P7K49_028553 [Saguinus oedipus]